MKPWTHEFRERVYAAFPWNRTPTIDACPCGCIDPIWVAKFAALRREDASDEDLGRFASKAIHLMGNEEQWLHYVPTFLERGLQKWSGHELVFYTFNRIRFEGHSDAGGVVFSGERAHVVQSILDDMWRSENVTERFDAINYAISVGTRLPNFGDWVENDLDLLRTLFESLESPVSADWMRKDWLVAGLASASAGNVLLEHGAQLKPDWSWEVLLAQHELCVELARTDGWTQ